MTNAQKEIIIKNLTEVIGVKVGKSVKGKGIEIFEEDAKFFSSYWNFPNIEDGSFLKELSAKVAKDPSVVDRMYIRQFYLQDYLKPHEFPSIADILTGEGLKDCKLIDIGLKGVKLYGHLPLSKYDATDIHSMEQLAKDVFALMGYKTSDEVLDSCYSEFDDIITFKEEHGWEKGRGNHKHIHGGLIAWDDKAEISQCWKLSNYNDGVVDDFWDFDLECTKEYLKNDLDPKGEITVYAYKGKKGYFGYTLNEQEYGELYYLDEDGEEAYDYAKFLYWKENKELLEEVAKVFEGHLHDVEVKGYIYNELRERSYSNSSDSEYNWSNNDNIFNLDLIDTMFDGEQVEFAHEIVDLVNWDEVTNAYKSPAQAVQKAYDLWLENNVIGKTDDGRYDQFVALVEGTGYVLTKTPIPNSSYVQHCVAYKGEEYHFFLAELLKAESAETFFTAVRDALAKRLTEKLKHSVLIQKSANVFVGLQDSFDSGNCNAGTMQFCHRHHIDTKQIGGMRGDVILGMEFSDFTRRAVMQAIVRQGGAA